MTLPEVTLWQELRGKRLDRLRFRRQHPIGPYILDFYCPSARLAIEVDGAAHDLPEQAAKDQARDAWLRAEGIRVLRFLARDVLDKEAIGNVIATVLAAATGRPSTAFGGPPPRQSRGGSSGASSPSRSRGR